VFDGFTIDGVFDVRVSAFGEPSCAGLELPGRTAMKRRLLDRRAFSAGACDVDVAPGGDAALVVLPVLKRRRMLEHHLDVTDSLAPHRAVGRPQLHLPGLGQPILVCPPIAATVRAPEYRRSRI